MAGPDRSKFERIYNAALEQQPEARAEFVRAECAGDDELRREVESLLGYDGAGLSQIDGPPRVGLPAGSRLGPYEIVGWAGAGGMGEVYKARDTRLNRTVAIKVLPPHLSANTDFRQRLERESKAVSALNHPHICTLYDVGHQDGIDYLVMEYLDGETLATRLAKGRLQIKDVLRYGSEIADALAAAHRRGILHRDLKPGNIMLTKSGAKLLDFGLAKVAPIAGEPSAETELTGVGTLLGTLPYMSPEQVQGKRADFRSDIFSCGAVLYEMAAGHAPFAADTRAGVIAAILEREPDLPSKTNSHVPPALEKLIQSCLVKDREDRQQSMHDAAQTIAWLQGGSLDGMAARGSQHRKTRERILWAALAALSAALLAGIFVHFRQTTTSLPPVRFQIVGPPNTYSPWYDLPALSPDGRNLVFAAQANTGAKSMLWLRSMDKMTLRPLAGTEEGSFPFWSPDSRYVVFFADRKLKKMDLTGGPPRTLCDADQWGSGGSWGSDGTVLFGSGGEGPSEKEGLRRVSAQGGPPQDVLPIDKARGEIHQKWPQFLPDGKRFLYFSQNVDPEKSEIRIGSLDSRETSVVLATQSRASFVPPGYLVFAQNRALMAQAFDSRKLRLSGNAFVIAEFVAYSLDQSDGGLAFFSVSSNGVLLWRSAINGSSRIISIARDGRPLGPIGEARSIEQIALSPDEKRLAVVIRNATGTHDIWMVEIATGTFSRVTSDPGGSQDPVWSPDGRELVFSSIRNVHPGVLPFFNLYRKRVGGPPEALLFESREPKFPAQWLSDGSLLFFTLWSKEFYRLPLAGEPKPELLFESEFDKGGPHVSPDGRWAAYTATDSGASEVYLESYPGFNERRQVSSGGGDGPLWGKKGKELYYQSDGKVMAVDVKAGPALEIGIPHELFALPRSGYAVTNDGSKFFVLQNVDDAASPMNVMQNWTAGSPH